MPYLTWVMSKFMGLGFSLEQVVAMATVKPAAVISRTPKLGSLQVGAPGDVAIMEQASVPRAERPAASAEGREYSQAERVSTRTHGLMVTNAALWH